jgi:hypothetical protein
MIKAILKNGSIHPLDPIPPDWVDGQELVVEESEAAPTERELFEWDQEIETLARKVPPEEHRRVLDAIAEHEAASKDAVRREWGLP